MRLNSLGFAYLAVRWRRRSRGFRNHAQSSRLLAHSTALGDGGIVQLARQVDEILRGNRFLLAQTAMADFTICPQTDLWRSDTRCFVYKASETVEIISSIRETIGIPPAHANWSRY